LQSDVRSVWEQFTVHQESMHGTARLDGILCNAGGLSNEPTFTAEGIETTFAAHLLFGTYLLVNLALPVLQATPTARVVVVSSGGMYNTKFPSWDKASGLSGEFDGQFAYAYSKRGQVLLCEKWTDMHPTIKFVSCHPGWVDTDGVSAAYGDKKKYLEPMRNLWEGSEGIIWLLVVPKEQLEGGAFYLDRTPRVKHMAGPFFTEGSFTKNTASEVADMMTNLDLWTTQGRYEERFSYVVKGNIVTPKKDSTGSSRVSTGPLAAMNRCVDIKRFMGRWYVHANIPTIFDRDTVNNIEDYIWDEGRNIILVSFKYSSPLLERDSSGGIIPGPQSEIKQHGTIMNDCCTEWALAVKFLIYWPVPTRYLIIGLDEVEGELDSYSSCMIGVPDRSCLWIMSRSSEPMGEAALKVYRRKAAALGYDTSKILTVPIIPTSELWQGDESFGDVSRGPSMASQLSPEDKVSVIEEMFSTLSDEEKTVCIRRLSSST
jgi:NAD(P)-dependent dehydrogenase (short-subunit alcohol dehydrogenase family)/lipocalin